MNHWQNDVKEFHRVMGLAIADHPTMSDEPTRLLRAALVAEEEEEVWSDLTNCTSTIADIAKELADLIYVTLGTAVSLGIDMDPVFQAVHESNMAKTDGPIRSDGKRMKPPGWQAPDIAAIIEAQS